MPASHKKSKARAGAAAPAAPRALTLTEALIPVVTLIVLIVVSVLLFGDEGFNGPNQIALVLAGMVAVWVARRAGYKLTDMNEAATASVSSGIGAIFILFAVGALIGTWAASGTLVAMVYYGMEWINPTFFPLSAFLACAAVATCLGSSWTTAGTIGVGFLGIAINMGIDPGLAAGAIISGAYVGELVSPLSDTANLSAGAGGVGLYDHLRRMFLPTLVTFLLALAFFYWRSVPVQVDVRDELAAIRAHFTMSPLLFLPLVVVAVLAVLRTSPFTTIMTGALAGALVAVIAAPLRVSGFADPLGDLPVVIAIIKGVWLILASGYHASMGHPTLDLLVSRGGMDSMLPTVWLVIAALAFGGVVERAGVLERLIEPIMAKAQSATRIVASVVGAVVVTNIVTADQYMAIVLPGRMFRESLSRRNFAPFVLTRTVAAAATPTSALVPWNSCGAYMSAALGVSTVHYLPYAVFNWMAPLVVIALAALGIGMKRE